MEHKKTQHVDIKISGIGSYLPERILTNHQLGTLVDTTDEWIVSRTGIRERRIASDDQITSDLATIALKNALCDANMEPSRLDGIIVSTTTPDVVFPSTAIKVQNNLRAGHGFAFDLQAVCSGFVYALVVARSMIISGHAKHIAVIGAETMSRIVDWTDRNTCVLFGDGAGAIIVSDAAYDITSDETKYNIPQLFDAKFFSDGSLHDILMVRGGVSSGNYNAKLNMNGREVYKHAVTGISSLTDQLLRNNNMTPNDLDWFIPHQANARIIDNVSSKLSMDKNKIVSTVGEHANTSAASIPLALDTYVKIGKIVKGQSILMVSVGAGLVFAGALMRW